MRDAVVHRLVRANDVEALRSLLQRAPSPTALVNELDGDGASPLFYAVTADEACPEMVELLLTNGADWTFVKLQVMPEIATDWLDEALAECDDEEELQILKSMASQSNGPAEIREPLLQKAIRQGNLDVLELLRTHGADFSYREQHGYTAVLDAVYGEGDRLPVIKYLINLGLPVDEVSSYGDTPLKSAYHIGHFNVVKELLAAGADEDVLAWSPLIRAVALGTLDDVRVELQQSPNLRGRDTWDRTAVHIAILRNDQELVELLHSAGADLQERGDSGETCLSSAVYSRNISLVEWLVNHGCSIDESDSLGNTVLATAASKGDLEMLRKLLKLGADPNAEQGFETLIESAATGEIIRALLEHGASPSDLKGPALHTLLGVPPAGEDLLATISREQYEAARFPREGTANPEEANEPFWLAMIKAGVTAYSARTHFDDEANFACKVGSIRSEAIWCATRFGQSLTLLPDGRMILIGGEHEDWYDPDFCIYNDVFVVNPDGEIRIFIYPYSVFPPTDSHTATLFEKWIYIIGSLGYQEERNAETPVYRLSTEDFHMETVATTGDRPARIFRHSAWLVGSEIEVCGGTRVTFPADGEEHVPNQEIFRLNLTTMAWSRV